MKRTFYLLLLVFVLTLVFIPKDTYALTSSQYKNRHVCSSYELAGAHTDGEAATVGCYNSYSEAKNAMISNGASDLFIFDETSSTTKIVDAMYAIVDLGGAEVVYLYESSSLSTRLYTGINTTGYGSDAAFIEINPSNYAAKIKIANFTGWVGRNNYTIIPINWIKRNTNYTVTNNAITHNYCANPATSTGYSATTIGPKPNMLSTGNYYSYDGHYFYTNMKTMLDDYKNNRNSNAVNKNNEYYNYYMYLSNRTKTTYSSINIDEYTRNVLGVKYDEYGDVDKDYASRLYGKGLYFYNTQQLYGVNALLSYSLSRNETANGTSNLAINKNNGFGLNAVDSSPTESARYYATFSSSIYGYASKWNSYGFSYATDWRYFGPAFGDKQNGMNVKYATDAYWSEKMAAKYYGLDSYYGLNDYNYYQLGVVTKPTNAYFNTSASRVIYTYPEAGDQLVIVGETGNYYKVMSDMNIDSNGNLVGSGSDYTKPYNWNANYVYVAKSDVKKINNGKNGYIDPSSVTNYKDSNYTYDLYVEDTVLKPKVAILNNDTNYYYDSALTSKTGKKVLKDKWVMVYSAAYNANGEIVSYLITSDYMLDQKHWVNASSLKFITTGYGKQTVNIPGEYEWVCSEPIDSSIYKIGGQYTNSYVPLLTSKVDSKGNVWYKVPVSLDTNTNSYGWILASEPNAHIDLTMHYVTNNNPVIIANDKEIIEGSSFDEKANVKATDSEDGDITSKIKVISNNVNTSLAGVYQITYSVTDNDNATTTKTINVVVKANNKPEISADDIEITVGGAFKELDGVTAKDLEDGNLTSKIKVTSNNVNTKVIGDYKVIYEVTDNNGGKTIKERKVSVVRDNDPVINASDKTISLNSKFDELSGVTATDREDGDITKNIKVIDNTVDTKVLGEYKVTYQVTDSYGNKVSKTIKIVVTEKKLVEAKGNFYLSYLKEKDGYLKLQGYQTIIGIDNNLNNDIIYEIVFQNIETLEEKVFEATRITKEEDIPKKVYSPDGKDYTYSWFNIKIDIDELDIGNYKMYVIAKTCDKYSKSLINNKVYNEQITEVKSNTNSAIISNNYDTSNSFIELKIRKDMLIEKTSSYIYNQYEKYTKFEFNDDTTLHLKGNSYSYGMDLSNNKNVERNIIFENKQTYKTYKMSLGSITNGNYKVILPVDDKLDKTRAWYDANIDISEIPKGEYVIYISTKSNISDISEMKEKLSRSLDNVVKTINNKIYSFSINKERGNRIELIVK